RLIHRQPTGGASELSRRTPRTIELGEDLSPGWVEDINRTRARLGDVNIAKAPIYRDVSDICVGPETARETVIKDRRAFDRRTDFNRLGQTADKEVNIARVQPHR